MMRNLLLATVCFAAGLAGCTEDGAPKSSHFEHDHEVPAHWPKDLGDAALKIRERLQVSSSEERLESDGRDQHPGEEVADLVSWVPEIAADTNLSESDWVPLDKAAESLSAELNRTGQVLTESGRQKAFELCELIEQSLTKIPDQLPPFKGSSR